MSPAWLNTIGMEKPMTDEHKPPEFWISMSEESFTNGPYDTREEAIAAAPDELDLEPDDSFWTCEAVWEQRTFCPPADWFLERALDQDFEAPEDACSDWLDDVTTEQTEELQELLDATWTAWLDKHNLRPKWFTAKDVQEHVVPDKEPTP